MTTFFNGIPFVGILNNGAEIAPFAQKLNFINASDVQRQAGENADTVDITIPAAPPVSGGILLTEFAYDLVAISALSFATIGHIIAPNAAMTIHAVLMRIDIVAGASYRPFLSEVGGLNELVAPINLGPTVVGAAATQSSIYLPFAAGIDLSAGDRYIVGLNRSDGGDTASITMTTISTDAAFAIPGDTETNRFVLANANPVAGNTMLSAGASKMSMGLVWSNDA